MIKERILIVSHGIAILAFLPLFLIFEGFSEMREAMQVEFKELKKDWQNAGGKSEHAKND